MATQEVTTRRRFNGALLALVPLAWLALTGLGKLAMDVMPGTQVDTTPPHAGDKHGIGEVKAVHDAMRSMALSSPAWFNRPPCKDGKFRFWAALANGKWAVWVLEQIGPGQFREITAFVTNSQSYVKTVHDDCGIDDWWGHSYG